MKKKWYPKAWDCGGQCKNKHFKIWMHRFSACLQLLQHLALIFLRLLPVSCLDEDYSKDFHYRYITSVQCFIYHFTAENRISTGSDIFVNVPPPQPSRIWKKTRSLTRHLEVKFQVLARLLWSRVGSDLILGGRGNIYKYVRSCL